MKFPIIFVITAIIISITEANMLDSMSQALGLSKTEEPTYIVSAKLASGQNPAEIRQYPAAKWVQTTFETSSSDLKSKTSPNFYKLFNYIGGKNSLNAKISMTAPVLMVLVNKAKGDLIDMKSEMSASMRFYVPKEKQDNTPVPTDGSVSFIKYRSEIINTGLKT